MEPANTTRMEPKVKAASIATYLSGVAVLAVFAAFTQDNNALLIDSLPDYIEPFVLPVVPAVVAAVSGYFAKHQWRSGE